MARNFDPKIGLVFKRVFGEHKNLCISLLNSMMPLEDNQRIVSIEYNPDAIVPRTDILNNSLVDVLCTDNHKRQFIVKIQVIWTGYFKSLIQFNAPKAYVRLLKEMDDYNLLQPVYALSFVTETFDKSQEYYHHYKIVNVYNTEQQIKGLELIFIELPKFQPQNIEEKKLHELWLRFLTEIEKTTQKIAPELFADEEIAEAIKYTDLGAYTFEELDIYDQWIFKIVSARSALSDYIKQGYAEAFEKSKAEENAEISRRLLTKGYSIEEITNITGLTVEQIENLK